MSRVLPPLRNGEQGPVYGFRLRDGAGIRDFASAAVEVYVQDGSGVSYGMRPGVIIGAKSDGTLHVQLKGHENDWEDQPKDLFLIPKIYYAMAPDLTPAVNLLLNPSFDSASGSNPARLPDNWQLIGARTATWDNYANDTAPPVIYAPGTFQLVNHATTSEPDYIQQGLAVSLAVGDPLSAGCWHRLGNATQVENDQHGIFFRPGSETNTIVRFRVGEQDWYFVRGTAITTVATSTAVMGIDGRGTTGSNRYDEAFCFRGRWGVFYGEAKRIPVHPRRTIPKNLNQLVGIGSFEKDSNADGVADSWSKQGTGGTFSIDKNPANVAHGAASQKVVLTDQSNVFLRYIYPGRIKVGDTWRASVKMKTQGALSAGVGTGSFNIVLRTDNFDAAPVQSAFTNLGTSLASFTDHQVSLAITTAMRSRLRVELNLNGYTGTLWLDDVRLERTIEGP